VHNSLPCAPGWLYAAAKLLMPATWFKYYLRSGSARELDIYRKFGR